MTTPLPRRAVTALIVTLGLAAACGDTAVTSGGATGGESLWGRTFLSVSVTEGGQPRPLVDGTRIRLHFTDERQVSASAGCNGTGGPAEVAGGRLVIDDLATTEMGCDPDRHAQDEWLARFLTARPALALAGAFLTFREGTTEIRLEDRETADPERPLRGTRWVVDTLVEGESASSVPAGLDAHLVFDDAGAVGGSTGCNQVGGDATVDEEAGTVTFAHVVATRRACEEDRMRVERAVLEVLDGEVAYEIEGDGLRLTHPGGTGLGLRAAGD